MEKLKSRVSLVGALRHNTREKMPANADASLSSDNSYTASFQTALKNYTEKLPEKVRKNAVHAVEVVLTASPEWFEKASEKQKQEFTNRSRKWLYDIFGKKNEILLAFHNDEKTGHIHGIFIPLVDGKLNAKKLIGGSRDRMRLFQDDFYEKVGRPLGMERGISKELTHKRHTSNKEFFRVLEDQKKDFHEVMGLTPEEVKEMSFRLDTWRKRTPEDLRDLASLYEERGAKNGYELDTIQKKDEQLKLQDTKKKGHSR